MRKTFQPREIAPETIRIGDTIKVTTMIHDVRVARVGVVQRESHFGQNHVAFLTRQGVTLFMYQPGVRSDYDYRITLLNRVGEPQTMLDFDSLDVDLNVRG